MLRTTTIALAAALVLGAASAAQAGGSKNDADSSGGYRVGPVGQSIYLGVNPADHRAVARGAYASTIRHGHIAPRTAR